MANGFIAEFLVKVGSVGVREVSTELQKSIDQTQKLQQSHERASKSSKDLFDTQAKGIIGTANSTKSFSKMAETIGSGGSASVVGAYATLAANLFAVSAAFEALHKAAGVEQITKGIEALGNRTGKSLDLTAEKLRTLTGDAISMQQSLTSTAQATSAGFSEKQLLRLGKVATNASFALGRDMTDSLDRLTRGVLKIEPELLDELGIMTRVNDATSAYAITVGKSVESLTNFEKRQAFLNAVATEGELKFDGLSEAAGNTKGYDKLAASMIDLKNNTLNVINTAMLPLAQMFAGSPASLTGAALLFVSTLKSQILPGFAQLSKKEQEAAEKLALHSRGTAQALTGFDNKLIIPKSVTSLSDKALGQNAGLSEYLIAEKRIEAKEAQLAAINERVQEGTLALSDKFTKEYNDEVKAVANAKHALGQMGNPTIQLRDYTKALNDLDNKAGITQGKINRSLFKSQKKGHEEDLEDIQAAKENVTKSFIEESKSTAHTQKNAAITAITNNDPTVSLGSKYKTAFIAYSASLEAFKKGAIEAAATGGKIASIAPKTFGAINTSIFALKSGTRLAGAALLDLLPIIGQLALAFGILKGAWDVFHDLTTSKAQKILNADLEEMDKIIDSLASKMKEYNRISSISAPINLKIADSLVITGNIASETEDKIKQIMLDRKKLLEDNLNKKNYTVEDKIRNNDRYTADNYGNVVKSTKLSRSLNIRDFKLQDSAEYKAYEQFYNSDIPELADNAKKALDAKDLIGKDSDQKIKIVGDALLSVTAKTKGLAEASQSLTQAYQDGDKAVGQFITGLATTTVYDGVVTSFENIDNTITTLIDNMTKAGSDTKKIGLALSGVSANILKLLSPDEQKTVETLKKLEGLKSKYEALNPGKNAKNDDYIQYYEVQIENQSKVLYGLRAELLIGEERNKQLQESERLTQNLLSVQDAYQKTLSNINSSTGAGVVAQQIAEANKANAKINSLYEQRLQINNTIKNTQKTISDSDRNVYNSVKEKILHSDNSASESDRQTYTNVKTKDEGIAKALAASKTATAEIDTIMSATLNTKQMELEAEEKNINVSNEQLKIRERINQTIGAARIIEQEISNIVSGTAKTYQASIGIIEAQSDLRLEALNIESEVSQKTLDIEKRKTEEANKRNDIVIKQAQQTLADDQKRKAPQATLELDQGALNLALSNQTSIAADRELIIFKQRSTAQQTAADKLNNSLTTQKSLTDSVTEEMERIGSLNEKRVATLTEALKAQQDIRATVTNIALAESEINDMLSGRDKNLQSEIRSMKIANQIRRDALQIENNTKNKTIEAQIFSANQSYRNTGNASVLKTTLDQLQTEKEIANQKYSVDLRDIDVQERKNILEKATFDVEIQGIQWQQDSLSIVEKELGYRNDILQSTQKTYETQQKLKLARSGLQDTPEQQNSRELRAASQTYELHMKEANVRMHMIDLEFALLDGQRTQLKEELETKKKILETQVGSDDPRIKTLNQVLSNLGTDLDPIREAAKEAQRSALQAEKAGLEALRNSKNLSPLLVNDPVNQVISLFDGIREQQRAREETDRAIAKKNIDNSGIKTQTDSTFTKATPFEETIKSPKPTEMQTVVSSLQKIVDSLQKIVDTKIVSDAPGVIAPGNITATGNAKKVIELLSGSGIFNTAEASGVAGALSGESGSFNPREKNSKRMEGIAQFDTKRRALLAQYLGKDISKTTLEEQVQYIIHEFMTTEKAAYNKIKELGKSDPRKVAALTTQYYERPSDRDYNRSVGKRMNNASSYYSQQSSIKTATKPEEVTKPEESSPLLDSIEADSSPRLDASKIDTSPLINLQKESDKTKSVTDDFKDTKASLKNIGFDDIFAAAILSVNAFSDKLKTLGPTGESVAAAAQGMLSITASVQNAVDVFKKLANDNSLEGITKKAAAVGQVISTTLGTINSVYQASAQAKEAGIEAEIAAEERRDGKTIQSQQKIRALQVQEDNEKRKAFEVNKKIMMAQAVIATATGVAGSLAQVATLGPAAFVLAALVGAMGLAEIAIIAGTSYQSSAPPAQNIPTNLTIGKTGSTIDTARNNPNAGGEIGYLRGTPGEGTSSANYAVIGSAYGGVVPRGYGNTAYVVGEHGPETITPDTPITVRPVNNTQMTQPVNASISIQALDASGVQDILVGQRGNIISMLREAANANGQNFLENVNVNVYTRPNVGRL